jgi:hypothetical protein
MSVVFDDITDRRTDNSRLDESNAQNEPETLKQEALALENTNVHCFYCIATVASEILCICECAALFNGLSRPD